MSNIIVKVQEIQSIDNLNIVKFDYKDITLTMVSLDLSEKIQFDTKVSLAIKPTHIALAKDINSIFSFANQIKAIVKDVNNGKLLSSIKLEVNDDIFESIITLEASLDMNIKVNDEIIMLIQASEISIKEILV